MQATAYGVAAHSEPGCASMRGARPVADYMLTCDLLATSVGARNRAFTCIRLDTTSKGIVAAMTPMAAQPAIQPLSPAQPGVKTLKIMLLLCQCWHVLQEQRRFSNEADPTYNVCWSSAAAMAPKAGKWRHLGLASDHYAAFCRCQRRLRRT